MEKCQGEGLAVKILVDNMLEGLARGLRLFGVDAAVVELPRTHASVAARCEAEGRVLATRDRKLAASGHVPSS